MTQFALTLFAWGIERKELEQGFRFHFRWSPVGVASEEDCEEAHGTLNVRVQIPARTAWRLALPTVDLRWLRGHVLGYVLEQMGEIDFEAIDLQQTPHVDWTIPSLPSSSFPVGLGETFRVEAPATTSFHSRLQPTRNGGQPKIARPSDILTSAPPPKGPRKLGDGAEPRESE